MSKRERIEQQFFDYLAAQRGKGRTPEPEPPLKVHTPLPEDLQHIVHHTHARVVGYDLNGDFQGESQESQDIAAVAAMNNALVLDVGALERELLGEGGAPRLPDDIYARLQQLRAIQAYTEAGWHISQVVEEAIRRILEEGGYAFLLEYEEGENQTPYGYQFGFPFLPRNYPNLALSSLPQLTAFTEQENDIWVIWRTGIVQTMASVQSDFERIGIPLAPKLLGKSLRRLGAGQATKLVDAEAAMVLGKSLITCNIGRLVQPGGLEYVVAHNRASVGSNEEIFSTCGMVRSHVDHIFGSNGQTLLDACWQVYYEDPCELHARVLRPGGALRVRRWDTQQLSDTGAILGLLLRKSSRGQVGQRQGPLGAEGVESFPAHEKQGSQDAPDCKVG